MTFLSWRKDYEVGVAQIDSEHRGLFDLINAYHETHARQSPARECALMLSRLIAYAEQHFQHEEELMREHAYPQLDEHCALHARLVDGIFGINERLAVDAVQTSAEILTFIKNWLIEHIVRCDMDIADFLRRKSAQSAAASAGADSPRPGETAAVGAAAELGRS